MTIDGEILRQIMRGWVAGVTVVTSVGAQPDSNGALERAGMTVSSFTSVSVNPATVLVCLNKETQTHDLAVASKVLGITILAQEQERVSAVFAGMIPELRDHGARLSSVDTFTLTSQAPLIVGGMGWLDCQATQMHDAGTHTIFVAEVIDQRISDRAPEPLVYYNRAYRKLV